jgi:hypothetical protein
MQPDRRQRRASVGLLSISPVDGIQRLGRSRLLASVLLGIAFLPAAYVFVVIQYSGLTYPFWDANDLLPYISDLISGHLSISSLWAPHNQSRPATLRVLYIFNARLTRWDIRSEFIFVYVAIYATFALQLRILWQLTGRRLSLPFAVGSLLVSLVLFSPAGHMNHWWSFMLQLNLASLLILYAFWRISRQGPTWWHTVLSAGAVWLATFTLTNGLIAALVVAIADHVTLRRPYVGRRTVFWAINIVVLFGLYLQNLPPGGARPSLTSLIWFAFIYLGSPLWDLFNYPFQSNFDVAGSTTGAGIVGIVLVALVLALCVRAWPRIRAADPAALLLLVMTLFAGGSALLTALGRANFDANGVAAATQSRYVIFGAYLLYGLVYYCAARAAHDEWRELVPGRLRVPAVAVGACVSAGVLIISVLAGVSYAHGVRSYTAARDFNDGLQAAYSLSPEAQSLDNYIYGVPNHARQIRGDLLRLRIGPYRNIDTVETTPPTTPGLAEPAVPVTLSPSLRLSQTFTAVHNRLVMLSIPLGGTAPVPAGVALDWTLFSSTEGKAPQRLAGAEVTLDRARGGVNLVTGDLGDTAGKDYTLVLSMPPSSSGGVEFVLAPRELRDQALRPVEIDRKPKPTHTLNMVQTSLND